MKRLGVFLLPPEWDDGPSQSYPQHSIRRYPFIHLGGEMHCESKVFCPRTQRSAPPGLKPGPPDPESNALTIRELRLLEGLFSGVLTLGRILGLHLKLTKRGKNFRRT